MTPIKRKLLYIFRGSLLRLRISWNHGEMLTLSVGYHVDKTDAKGKLKWDGSRCRQNTTHGEDKIPASTINREIEILEDKIDKAFLEYEKQDLMPTKDQLKNRLSDKPEKINKSIFDIYDEFIKDGTETRFWSKGSIEKYRSSKKILMAFDKMHKLTLDNLDEATLSKYVIFQTSNCISKKRNKESYINSTISSNIKILKLFLTWADRNGYHVNNAYKNFKHSLKTPEKQVIFLDWNELMRVYNHDFSDNKFMEKVRDGFCLCCFTSLRYSDLANLKKTNVFDDHIIITTVKTSNTIRIDLNKYSKAIVDKYKDWDSEKVLPVTDLTRMNLCLKEICKICKIDTPINITTFVGNKRYDKVMKKWELISSHCGRRTFICNALSMGIAPNIVMKWTGHSDYKSMKPYIDIADNMRKNAMEAFDNREPDQ